MSKLFNSVLPVIGMLCTAQAMASAPVFLMNPQGTLPTSIPTGQTVTAKYTVTNNVPFVLSDNGLTAQRGVTQNTGAVNTPPTCADPFTLLVGGSCTLELNITLPVSGGPEICNTKNNPVRCEIPAAGNGLQVGEALGLGLAVGVDSTAFGGPLLIQTSNNGETWGAKYVAGGLPGPAGTFRSTSCISNFCIAVGDSAGIPLIAQSMDAGQTWAMVPFVAPSGQFLGSGCLSTICVAVGNDGTGAPLIAQTIDGGSSWSLVGSLPTSGEFFAASCTGDTCIAVGDDTLSNALIVQTIDGGNAWNPVSLSALGSFSAAACNTIVCIAAGVDSTGSVPMLAQSLDGGSWSLVTTGLPTDGNFFTASCNSTYCIAGGGTTSNAPILVQSTQGGSWNSISTLSSIAGEITSTSCSNAICTAVGWDFSNFPFPAAMFVAQSTDFNTWGTVAVSGLSNSALGQLNGTGCSDNFCIGVGGLSASGNLQPLIVQTTNAGKSWSIVSNIVDAPSQGILHATTSVK